jgi:indolepyruvate ferredoxin oxidoreductase alpha subunit
MGASVSSLHGFLKARPEMAKTTVAVIGDSTFHHSGMTGLLNIVYNNTPATVMILDNHVTAMTGQQANPGTGVTLKGGGAPVLDLEALCKGIGVNRVFTADPREQKILEELVIAECAADKPSVIIVRRECVL